MTSSIERGQNKTPNKKNDDRSSSAYVPNRAGHSTMDHGAGTIYGGSQSGNGMQQRAQDDLIAQLRVHLDKEKRTLGAASPQE